MSANNLLSLGSFGLHGRYRYSPIDERPVYDWPKGKRLAVHFCLNVEHFHFGRGWGNDYAVAQPQPNIRSYGWRDYGNRVGVWRLLSLAREFDLPIAVLVNTDLDRFCPEIIEAFTKQRGEIVAHGRTNSERQIDMTIEEEAACIREATETIYKNQGQRPAGWLAPYICQTLSTPELLKDNGYQYMMDWPIDDQ